eukprot:8478470-Pyramimonas_sp.AAC.1
MLAAPRTTDADDAVPGDADDALNGAPRDTTEHHGTPPDTSISVSVSLSISPSISFNWTP